MKYKNLKIIGSLLLLGVALISYARSNTYPKNLRDAAVADNAGAVKRFIAQGADPDEKNQYGDTALMIGAAWGSINAVTALLDNGADVNFKGGDGGTALMGAAAIGREAMVKLLLDRGAEIDAREEKGQSALTAAVIKNQKKNRKNTAG
jgi:ankyrin repeat protein